MDNNTYVLGDTVIILPCDLSIPSTISYIYISTTPLGQLQQTGYYVTVITTYHYVWTIEGSGLSGMVAGDTFTITQDLLDFISKSGTFKNNNFVIEASWWATYTSE